MARVLKGCAVGLLAVAVFVAVASASGDSPLTKAVKANDVQAVRALVKSGADVNVRGDGSTPLLWAANNGSVEIARLLIASKATVDAANDYGVTPLLQASRVGDSAMVDLLLRSGANPATSGRRDSAARGVASGKRAGGAPAAHARR
jgi:ankyrin repeat protein